MAIKAVLHRIAIRAELWLDHIRPRQAPDNPVLDPYLGYATPRGAVLRGRVLAALRRTTPDPEQSRWQNIREMVSLFLTDEVADIPVHAPDAEAQGISDDEGYVTLEVAGQLAPGWQEIAVEIVGKPETRALFPVLVPQAGAAIGVISDIDDTMMQTGAYSLARNLWTTFTGSAMTRRIFPDAIVLMDHLSDHGRNPIYYVSSSPWNLHAFLARVFDRAGLVRGPMFLRDLGISETQLISGTHGDHKGAAIDEIMAANPDLPFILIGDTGQHDAHVYLEACHRHGGRIKAVVLREPGPGPDDASRADMAAMRRLNVVVTGGTDFVSVAEVLAHSGVDLG